MLESSPPACHNLIGCLDGFWHFGRAYVDDHVELRSSAVADVDDDMPPPPSVVGLDSPQNLAHMLYPLFRLLDEDGDDHVSLDEMRSLLCKLGKDEST